MNRRGFFQTIIAGITALCLPRRKKAEREIAVGPAVVGKDESGVVAYDIPNGVCHLPTKEEINDCIVRYFCLAREQRSHNEQQRELYKRYFAGQQWGLDVGTNHRYMTIQVKEKPNAEGNEST